MQALTPAQDLSTQESLTLWLGLAFILLGCVTSAFSAQQYLRVLKSLQPAEFPPGYAAKWGIAINWLLTIMGVSLSLILVMG